MKNRHRNNGLGRPFLPILRDTPYLAFRGLKGHPGKEGKKVMSHDQRQSPVVAQIEPLAMPALV